MMIDGEIGESTIDTLVKTQDEVMVKMLSFKSLNEIFVCFFSYDL